MQIVIIGAGPAGLFLGSALARRGHQVTAVDRDPGPADDATWARRGVMQFHHAHAFRQTVVEALGREVPETLDLWRAAGAEAIEFEDYGGAIMRLGLRSRRETFERCLRAAALATPGFTLRLGHVETRARAGRSSRRRGRGRRTRGGRPGRRRVRAGRPCDPGAGGARRRRRTVRPGLRRPRVPAEARRRARPDDQPDRLAGGPRRLPVPGVPPRAGHVLGAHRAAGRRLRAARPASPGGLRGRGAGDPRPRRLDRPRARGAGHRRPRRRRPAQRLSQPVRRARRPGAAGAVLRRRQRRHHDAGVRPRHHHDAVAVRGAAEPARPRRRRPGRRPVTPSTPGAPTRCAPGWRTTSTWTPPTSTGGTAATSTWRRRCRPT